MNITLILYADDSSFILANKSTDQLNANLNDCTMYYLGQEQNDFNHSNYSERNSAKPLGLSTDESLSFWEYTE